MSSLGHHRWRGRRKAARQRAAWFRLGLSCCVSGSLRQSGARPSGARPGRHSCGAQAVDWSLVIERAACLWVYLRMFQVAETLCKVAVQYTARVDVISCDRPRVVDDRRLGALTAACTRARNVVGFDLAVASAHEAVIHIVRILVLSRDHPCVVDGPRRGALTAGLPCARRIELGNLAVRIADEAVIRGVGVLPPTGGRTRRVDGFSGS